MSSLTQNPKTLRARVVSGSIVLLSGSGLATAVNMAYNVAVARFLGPTGFGHATVVYTLLTLISAVTLSFQKTLQRERPRFIAASTNRRGHAGLWLR